jgi:hypothetical protein
MSVVASRALSESSAFSKLKLPSPLNDNLATVATLWFNALKPPTQIDKATLSGWRGTTLHLASNCVETMLRLLTVSSSLPLYGYMTANLCFKSQ